MRTRRNQSACGMRTLNNIKPQKLQAYGPNMRFIIMYCSKISPLYHDMNPSIK